MGGEAKIGKTFNIFSGYAKALAFGTPLFNNPDWYVTRECRVLVIEQELGPYILKKRIEKIYEDSPIELFQNNLFYVSKEPKVTLDSGLSILRDIVDEIQPNVLILDPVSKFHAGNENDNTDMEKVIRGIEELKNRYVHNDLSVILTHHFGKPPIGDYAKDVDRLSPYSFRGAGKFFDSPDTIHTINRLREFTKKSPSGEQYKGWHMKNRIITRGNESPPDFYTNFNFNGDQNVLFERYEGEKNKIALSLPKMITINTKVIDSARLEPGDLFPPED
jgi:AAA domain